MDHSLEPTLAQERNERYRRQLSVNVALEPDALGGTAWIDGGTTVTDNQKTAADGTLIADKVSALLIGSKLEQRVTLAPSTSYILSFDLEEGTDPQTKIGLETSGKAAVGHLLIDWTSGVPSTNALSGTAGSATYEQKRIGLYTVSVQITTPVTVTAYDIQLFPAPSLGDSNHVFASAAHLQSK